MRLTPYAQAHLRLLEIDRRFDVVQRRNIHRHACSWDYSDARGVGKAELRQLPQTLAAFDLAIRHKRHPSFS